MQSLLVSLKCFNLFPSLVRLPHSLPHIDETLSIADVIHSDAGGLGKSDAMGDAGQSCPFTLIELIIWFSFRAFDFSRKKKIRFLSQWYCAADAGLFNDFLLTFEIMGVFCWNCHQGKRKQFSGEEMRITSVLWAQCLHSARSIDGLRMSEDRQGQFLLEDQRREAVRHEVGAFINTEINVFNLKNAREH